MLTNLNDCDADEEEVKTINYIYQISGKNSIKWNRRGRLFIEVLFLHSESHHFRRTVL